MWNQIKAVRKEAFFSKADYHFILGYCMLTWESLWEFNSEGKI